MKTRSTAALLLLLPICVLALRAAQKETPMPHHATGPFEVKLTPLDPAFKAEDNSIGRYSLDKQFHGALEATSKGEMLSGAGTAQLTGLQGSMEIIIKEGKHSYDLTYTLP